MIRTLVLFALSVPVLAQTTVTIPAPDGKTIVSNNNVWSCTPTGLPPGMTFDGITLSVPKIALTAGAVYPAGLYLVSFDDNSDVTFSPYTAPKGSNLTVASVTVPSTSFAAFQTLSIPLADADIPAFSTAAIVTLNSQTELTKGGIFRYSYTTSAGKLTLTVTSTVGSAQTYGPYPVTISVLQ